MYYLDQVYVIQPHVVKLHRHRLREEIRQPSSMTKSSSNSILHVTIRSQNSAYTTGKKFNNEQKQLQLNSTQRSKDLIRSANVYGIGSGGHGFLKNKVEPEKSFDSFKSSIKSDVSPSGDLYKADRNRDETTLQLDEFLGNKSPNSINNDSEINKNYPRAVTPDRLFLMNGVRKRKFKNQLRKKYFSNRCCECSCMRIIGSLFAAVCVGIVICAILLGSLIRSNKPATSIYFSTITSTIFIKTTTTTTASTARPEILTSLPENSIINITCISPTPTISIQYAFYGVYNNTGCSCSPSNCTEMDVTQTVISYCANISNPSICLFIANNGFFNDTCIGKPKLFSLTYACI
ncbi:unnamed protein product [Adineta steineri]|uniref:Uncharacterized protein n=1 Tax=Adineta steineri TaxID=433720 RepID=A0A819N5C7_9BILA|nr:unnamed protein product [Adineta steineri]